MKLRSTIFITFLIYVLSPLSAKAQARNCSRIDATTASRSVTTDANNVVVSETVTYTVTCSDTNYDPLRQYSSAPNTNTGTGQSTYSQTGALVACPPYMDISFYWAPTTATQNSFDNIAQNYAADGSGSGRCYTTTRTTMTTYCDGSLAGRAPTLAKPRDTGLRRY